MTRHGKWQHYKNYFKNARGQVGEIQWNLTTSTFGKKVNVDIFSQIWIKVFEMNKRNESLRSLFQIFKCERKQGKITYLWVVNEGTFIQVPAFQWWEAFKKVILFGRLIVCGVVVVVWRLLLKGNWRLLYLSGGWYWVYGGGAIVAEVECRWGWGGDMRWWG